jgi:hypothetical protein
MNHLQDTPSAPELPGGTLLVLGIHAPLEGEAAMVLLQPVGTARAWRFVARPGAAAIVEVLRSIAAEPPAVGELRIAVVERPLGRLGGGTDPAKELRDATFEAGRWAACCEAFGFVVRPTDPQEWRPLVDPDHDQRPRMSQRRLLARAREFAREKLDLPDTTEQTAQAACLAAWGLQSMHALAVLAQEEQGEAANE